MHEAELRALFPAHLVRGALLRPDGIAVGLVCGGAPAWDLLPSAARAQVGGDYHRLLLALEYPVDIFILDRPPDLETELAELRARRDAAPHPVLADALGEIAEYLDDLGGGGSRAKQVVWAVTAEGGTGPARAGLDLPGLLRGSPGRVSGSGGAGQATLGLAVERARRLAEALRALRGTPPARLMEAEEIARLVYALADPVRASRYPLAGSLLDRVRRVATAALPGGR